MSTTRALSSTKHHNSDIFLPQCGRDAYVNLERLRALHALSEYGSVAAAAEALHLTPSAVSQQLAKLEREVGQGLLIRDGRGVRLTDPARRLADHACRVLVVLEEAQADLEESRGAVYGTLTIAAFATAARGLAPHLITAVGREHPQLVIRVSEQDPAESLPSLAHGTVDIAITQDWASARTVPPTNLAGTSLFDDLVDLAVPAGHPLARHETVDLHDLADERWISWREGSTCHGWLVSMLRASGIEPIIAHSVSEHPTQLALVAAGHGIGIVPRLGRGQVPPEVRILQLRPILARRVRAIWRSGADRRPAVAATLRALRAGAPWS